MFRLRLNGKLGSVNMVSETMEAAMVVSATPESEVKMADTTDKLEEPFIYVSFNDAASKDYQSITDFAFYAMKRDAGSLRTCRNCGGINHFSHKDGVLVCPTPEGSVDTALLRRVRYPIGVRPWKFGSGRGVGKGKGKGRGGRSGRGGRGGYWMWSEEPQAEAPAEDADNGGYYVGGISDDYDGFNN